MTLQSLDVEDERGSEFEGGKKDRVPLVLNFHFQLACLSGFLLLFDIIGCKLTHVIVPNLGGIVTALVIVVAGLQALPAFWHSRGRTDLRDAALTLPWFALFVVLLPYPIDIATKIGSQLPIQDPAFTQIDTWLGINVPSIARWATHNAFGLFTIRCYGALVPFMYLALLVPALTGKAERAQQYVLVSFLMMLVGIPILVLLPAVGPWYGFHTAAYPAETQVQADLFALRQSGQFGPYTHHFAAVVCFPSGHVMGAIMAGYSLWIFRYIRIPIVLLSALIIIATMTTEWHYFVDVLGGMIEVSILILFARWLSRKKQLAIEGSSSTP